MADSIFISEDERRTIKEWVNSSTSLRIVIFGKTGAGKSSLINTLFNDPKTAKEGHRVYAETKVASSYTKVITLTINDICVTLWDTPGFKDPFSDGEKTMKEIKDNCDIRNIDLFVYCIRFDQTRLGQDDVDCIRDITKAFGDGIWKRALFALTFANQATLPPSSNMESLKEYFQSCKDDWSNVLRCVVRENVGPREIPIGKIPVVATSYQYLPLPDGRNWFMDFWGACLLQVKLFTITALLRAAGDRVKGEVERAVAAKVIGQRLAEIGGGITQELGAEIRTQIPQVVATAEWSDIMIEATQSI